jgi:hypothetical protein
MINDYFQKALSKNIGPRTNIRDAVAKAKIHGHDKDVLSELSDGLFSYVVNNVKETGKIQRLSELRDSFKIKFTDSYFNPVTGVGTNIDPSIYATASVPTVLSPREATGLYSSGGLVKVILDKKVESLLINGYCFEGKSWNRKSLDRLRDYAKSKGFDESLASSFRDGLLYGGSGIFSHHKGDDADTSQLGGKSFRNFAKKDSLERFWTADRWNLSMVPDYNISAKTYLTPDLIYCPIAGKSFATSRISMIRPNPLPYWGTIQQLGWGVSDVEGWLGSVLAYEIMTKTIPMMGQQMSLMYHYMPLDGQLAMMGAEATKEFVDENNRQLAGWSITNPKTVNSFAEIKTVERNYQGYNELVMLLRQDIGAKTGLPERELFDTQSTGFGTDEDVPVRKSETLKSLQRRLEPQVKGILPALVYSCFGNDSPESDMIDDLCISFNTPSALTDEQLMKHGSNFFSMIQMGTSTGMSLKDSMRMANKFIPTNIDDDEIESIEEEDVDGASEPSVSSAPSDPGSENAKRKQKKVFLGKGDRYGREG